MFCKSANGKSHLEHKTDESGKSPLVLKIVVPICAVFVAYYGFRMWTFHRQLQDIRPSDILEVRIAGQGKKLVIHDRREISRLLREIKSTRLWMPNHPKAEQHVVMTFVLEEDEIDCSMKTLQDVDSDYVYIDMTDSGFNMGHRKSQYFYQYLKSKGLID
jgi:hypothetical protein